MGDHGKHGLLFEGRGGAGDESAGSDFTGDGEEVTWWQGYDPLGGLVLPEWDPPEQPMFSPEDMRRIIAAAEPPYDTVYWLLAQTGIRRGEVCGLDVGHVDLVSCIIVVKRSRSGRHITDTKSRKPRIFSISATCAAP